MQQSSRFRPVTESQGRVHANGLLAQCQWELGHVEQACQTWDRFLDDYTVLSTARGDEYFGVLRRSVRSVSSRLVRQLDQRVRLVVVPALNFAVSRDDSSAPVRSALTRCGAKSYRRRVGLLLA